ncbi:MAG: hypothetical protein R3B45_04570 [Bdellovibrionota bacterium]
MVNRYINRRYLGGFVISAAEVLNNKVIPLNEGIVFISRSNLRPIFRKMLKELGIEDITTPDTFEACILELAKNDNALFILDWTDNKEEASKLLSAAQGRFACDTRPIFLLTQDAPYELYGLAAEYNVTRVHSGDISVKTISANLSQIIADEANSSSFRKKISRIAQIQISGDWKKSEKYINELLNEHVDDPVLLGELINNSIQLNHWDEAYQHSQKLNALYPVNIRGMHLLARCKMKQGLFDEAREILKNASIINPFNPQRLVDLGTAYLYTGSTEKANESFTQALELKSDLISAQKGLSKCLLLEGDINEALVLLKTFSSSLELASVFNDAAIISIHSGKYDEGLKLYKAAIKALKDKNQIIAKLLFNIGIAHFKLNDLEQAYKFFKYSMEKDSSFESAVHNVRVCERQIHQTDKERSHETTPEDQKNSELVDQFNESFEDESF